MTIPPETPKPCWCSMHSDCRSAAIAGCGLCARYEIESWEKAGKAFARASAKECFKLYSRAPSAPQDDAVAAALTQILESQKAILIPRHRKEAVEAIAARRAARDAKEKQ